MNNTQSESELGRDACTPSSGICQGRRVDPSDEKINLTKDQIKKAPDWDGKMWDESTYLADVGGYYDASRPS